MYCFSLGRLIKTIWYAVVLFLALSLSGCSDSGSSTSTVDKGVDGDETGGSQKEIKFGDLIITLGDGKYLSVAHHPYEPIVAVGTESGNVVLFDYTDDDVLFRERLRGHTEQVRSLVFSSNGRLMVSGSDDGSAKIWDISEVEHQQIATLAHNEGNDGTDDVLSVSFSGNDNLIVSASLNGIVKIWDTTGKQIGKKITHLTSSSSRGEVYAVASNYDGSRIMVSGSGSTNNGTITMWDWDDERNVYAHDAADQSLTLNFLGIVSSLAFDHSLDIIVSGDDKTSVKIWRRDYPGGNYNPTTIASTAFKQASALALSIDGASVVIANNNNNITVFDTRSTNQQTISLTQPGNTEMLAVAVDKSNDYIAGVGADKILRIWNVADGSDIQPDPTGHTDAIRSVAFDSSNNLVVSGSDDQTVKVWRWGGINSASSRDKLIISNLIGHEDAVTSVKFNKDASIIASSSEDKTIKIWYRSTNDTYILKYDLSHDSMGAVRSVSFDDEDRILSGGGDKSIRIWDAKTGSLLDSVEHTSTSRAVLFSHDGNTIASGSLNRIVAIWDKSGDSYSRSRPFLNTDSPVYSISLSSDNEYLVSGGSGNSASDGKGIVQIWNIMQGRQFGLNLYESRSVVYSVAYSTDVRIASGGDDQIIRIRGALDGELDLSMLGHEGIVWSVAFSSNNEYVVSGSDDTTVKIWCVQDTRTTKICK